MVGEEEEEMMVAVQSWLTSSFLICYNEGPMQQQQQPQPNSKLQQLYTFSSPTFFTPEVNYNFF